MGWVTDITFVDGVELNDTKIRKGMTTQVRWDVGIGSINIDKDGKIVPDVWHGYPLCLQQKEDYQKELASWTGYMDTNMGVLFFKEGQLQHLDLSYEDIGSWAVNNIETHWNSPDKAGLYHALTAEQWLNVNANLNLYRGLLVSEDKINEDEKGGYALTIARQKYLGRSGELIDPYYKDPIPNGFVRT